MMFPVISEFKISDALFDHVILGAHRSLLHILNHSSVVSGDVRRALSDGVCLRYYDTMELRCWSTKE